MHTFSTPLEPIVLTFILSMTNIQEVVHIKYVQLNEFGDKQNHHHNLHHKHIHQFQNFLPPSLFIYYYFVIRTLHIRTTLLEIWMIQMVSLLPSI